MPKQKGNQIIEQDQIIDEQNQTINEDSLEAAANLLLTQLQPTVRDFAIEISDQVLKIKRWQLLLGSLLAQYESGSLPAPSLDPAWMRGEIISPFSTCKECGQQFEAQRYTQRFCSNDCGNRYAARQLKLSKQEALTL